LQSTSFALALSWAFAACAPAPATTVVVSGNRGELTVRAEVAATPEARRKGLMWRNRLSETEGMLFVFPAEQTLSFWMKNTPVALDIIFISEASRVVSVMPNTRPYSAQPVLSGAPARYVLEVAAGLTTEHGIGPGNRVKLPPLGRIEVR